MLATESSWSCGSRPHASWRRQRDLVEVRSERRLRLEELLKQVGSDAVIRPPLYVDDGRHLNPAERRTGIEGAGPITVGDNVWLGGGAIVLANVTIGDDTAVGAGAVVTKDLPAGVVAVGSPARIIREL